MERYSFPNEVVGGSIPALKSSLYVTEKPSYMGRKPRTHSPQGKQ